MRFGRAVRGFLSPLLKFQRIFFVKKCCGLEERFATDMPAMDMMVNFFGVLFLTLSVATPVSSLFVIVPGMLSVAGTGAVWAMLLATIVCIATAYVYAELASNWPVAGGEYVMVARTLGPMSGFVMLGVNAFNNLLFPPVAGLGLSAVLAVIWPGLPQIPLALAVVIGATLVSLLQIRVNALITGAFLLVELIAAALVIWFGFGHAVRGATGFLSAPVMLGADAAQLVPAMLSKRTNRRRGNSMAPAVRLTICRPPGM